MAPTFLGSRKKITNPADVENAAKTEASIRAALKPGASVVVAYYGTVDPMQDKLYLVGSTVPGPWKKSNFENVFEALAPSIGDHSFDQSIDVSPGAAGGSSGVVRPRWTEWM